MMNALENYIAKLDPIVFLSAQNVDGSYNSTLTNNANIAEWKNLMGDSNWDFVRRDAFNYPTQFSNTVQPKFLTDKLNGFSAVDFTQSFLVPRVYNNTVDIITNGTNEFTCIRVKQVNDDNKFDMDFGSASMNFGCALDYNGQRTNIEKISRTGIELNSGRLFPPFYEIGALNRQYTFSVIRWKANDLDMSSWYNNDGRYRYTNKTTDVAAPRLRQSVGGALGTGLPMIGGVWERQDASNNQPYGYGTPAIISNAILYYEFILIPRYINDRELMQVRTYIKLKYNI